MKRFTFKKIALLLCLLFTIKVSAQVTDNGDGTINITDQSSSNPYTLPVGDQTARDEIDVSLPQGSTGEIIMSPSGSDENHLYINPNIILPVVNQTANGSSGGGGSPFSGHDLDLSLPVGSIEGDISVSSSGQASYSIPIKLPPGTNGLIPSISISYNSGSFSELAGLGFDIAGISVISRCPLDVYHDGVQQSTASYGISFASNGPLEYNGERMISIGSNMYALESENFTRIKYDATNDNFLLETKDGTKMEFGNTSSSSNSKLILKNSSGTAATHAYAYYISKIYDNYGNFIIFNYDKTSTTNSNEIFLKEIQYTGNEDLSNGNVRVSPYNSIKFYYDTKTNNYTKYINGYAISKSIVLRQIEISCENVVCRKYDFNYAYNNKHTLLNEIIESGSDGSKLNSTLIAYGNGQDPSVATTEPVDDQGNSFPSNADLRVADFNGDGLADILAFTYAADAQGIEVQSNGIRFYNGWKLYLNQDGGTTFKKTDSYTASFNGEFSPFQYSAYTSPFFPNEPAQFVDFNADGKVDMYVLIGNGGTGTVDSYRAYISNGTSFSVIPSNGQAGVGSSNSFGLPAFSQIAWGDFDGDKKMEGISLATQCPECTDSNGPYIRFFKYDESSGKMIVAVPQNSSFSIQGTDGTHFLTEYGGFSAVDFDGDGTMELMGIRNSTNVILKVSGVMYFNLSSFPEVSFTMKEIYTYPSTIPDHGHFLPGDYNGDGINDMAYLYNATQISYGTGTEITSNTSISNIPGYWQDMNVKHLSLDANGDGITDIVDLHHDNSGNMSVNVNYVEDAGHFNRVNFTLNSKTFPLIKDHMNQINFYVNHNWTTLDNSNMNNFGGECCGNGHDINGNPQTCSAGFSCDDQYPPAAKDNEDFATGDFDGDGHDDILLKTYSSTSNTRSIIFIDPYSKDNFVTHILDGFNNQTDIDYQSLSKGDNAFYTPSSTAPSYPLYDAVSSHLFATKSITQPDGIGGTSETDYSYSGGAFHVTGRGFVGFDQENILDNNISRLQQDNYTLDPTYFVRLPNTSTITYTTLSELLEQTTYGFSIYSFGSKRFFIEADNVTSVDKITNVTNTTDNYYDGNTTHGSSNTITNGNITKVVKSNGNGTEAVTVDNTYIAGSWLTLTPSMLSRLETQKTTVTRSLPSSEADYVRETDYTYYHNTGELWTITQDPGKDNSVLTNLTYDDNTGVLTNKLITAPNASNPVMLGESTTLQYDNYFRLPLKQTDPAGQVTELTYNFIFGKPASIKTIDGLISYVAYDGYGRVDKIITPDNLTTTSSINWYQPGVSIDLANDPYTNSNLSNLLFYTETSRPGSPTAVQLFDHFSRIIKTQRDGFNNHLANITAYDNRGLVSTQIADYLIPNNNSQEILTTTTTYYDDILKPQTQTLSNSGGISQLTQFSYSYSGGNTTTTIQPPDHKTYTRTTDPIGLLYKSTDNGGTLVYNYWSNRMVKNITLNGASVSSMEYDDYAYPSKLTEANTGITTYTYNAYGQLYNQIDNKTQNTKYEYDVLNRLSKETAPDGTTYNYQYITNTGSGTLPGAGQLQQVNAPGNISITFGYDQLSRMNQFTETVDGTNYTTQYQYDGNSNIIKKTYPGNGFALQYEYDNLGFPTKMTRADNGNLVWRADEMDQFSQYNKYTLGNNIQTVKSYDVLGFPTLFQAGNIQNLTLNFEQTTGNLNYRTDNIKNLTETFTYDATNNLDQLASWQVSGLPIYTASYAQNGNIQNKSDIGGYTYSNSKINALVRVDNINGLISSNKQSIDYTYFNKTQRIQELDVTNNDALLNEVDITYGADKQRIKSDNRDANGSIISTKYYLNEYEKEVMPNGSSREVNYVYSPEGLTGMFVNDNGTQNFYYVYSDHLGSINTLTDEQGTIFAEQNFDPWGRPRNPQTWDYSTPTNALPAWLTRGYTGHEYLPQFSLINMNGRMYDPINARMLSADNVVSDPLNTQSFNRYTYCYNNPLKYTDPSGYTASGVGIGSGGTTSLSSGSGDFFRGAADEDTWEKEDKRLEEQEEYHRQMHKYLFNRGKGHTEYIKRICGNPDHAGKHKDYTKKVFVYDHPNGEGLTRPERNYGASTASTYTPPIRSLANPSINTYQAGYNYNSGYQGVQIRINNTSGFSPSSTNWIQSIRTNNLPTDTKNYPYNDPQPNPRFKGIIFPYYNTPSEQSTNRFYDFPGRNYINNTYWIAELSLVKKGILPFLNQPIYTIQWGFEFKNNNIYAIPIKVVNPSAEHMKYINALGWPDINYNPFTR